MIYRERRVKRERNKQTHFENFTKHPCWPLSLRLFFKKTLTMFIMEGSGAEADGAEESKMLLVLILERTESSDDATFSLSLSV